jgi:hypothetical protein
MKKRVAVMMLVLFLAITGCSMAATAAKAAAPASAQGGVVGKFGFGCEGLTVTSNAATMPTVQYWLTKDMAVEGGFGLSSSSAATTFVILAAIKNRIMEPMGNIHPLWGGGIAFVSSAGTTNIVLSANIGAEYFITPDFSLEGNISPIAISMASAGGASSTTFNIMGPAAGIPTVVIGAHLYI